MSIIENFDNLNELHAFCQSCSGCGLAATRQKVVFGEGNGRAKIFLLGEAPGAREDETGRPFVGRAGELLDRLLAGAGLKRGDVYITGSLKCRPPRNRNPYRGELAACRPFLGKQLALISPRVVVCLGLVAVQNMIDAKARLADVRGLWFDLDGYRVFPTYHPAAVVRGTVSEELLARDFRTVAGAVKGS